ncbi:hypothetical protein A3A71_00980 [Candidatus Berkelbacteria bacterium RIFCSPLOWO2_01_FULL_50_28]|uniref:Uncharacterized protein n=1 Tax=Candidatus Berkelbacteria bacterium RIFCSPLOWO2_01_FULL_50_28 TaxID=1797471 RepID=A0A1F5EBM1_9BACT|nr:MAG: hypothetical protein A2807_01550 [Candidatus Berkelbacteria bacterium RIFCSPHIGHO2_01_FULL_50_36]OGD62782.1 MAG: hypothetical protein A3F39_03785 [Candidatus Berkelbacteria bacterium RIFCSPHIGHO2_12_FULL_50_11]OGD64614.1 MAG: hypothetical protein A3A71_00980 [Candidatus Berkelbacteria bacterium RIFCSPLOWO2_01_FULL_50_28]
MEDVSTVGGFIDLLLKREENQFGMLSSVLKLAEANYDPGNWARWLTQPLCPEEIYPLCEVINSTYQRILVGIDTDECYKSTIENAHRHQLLVFTEAAALGVELDRERVDAPVSMSDALIRAQSVTT